MSDSMNFVDKAISVFSPTAGLKRMQARAALDVSKRYYDGATRGRRGASIRHRLGDANQTSLHTIQGLRAASHDLVRNNVYARRGVEAIVSNTIGKGVVPQFMRGRDVDSRLQSLSKSFLETTDCDADGRHNLFGLQALIARTVVESGECLIRRRFRRDSDGLPVAMQYQVIEPDFLDQMKDQELTGGGRIVQGVEFDAIGRRVAYWLYKQHPGSNMISTSSVRVPAENIIHCYDPQRPGQARGIPWLAPVILPLADFHDYLDAQRVRQKIAACFTAFVTGEDSSGLAVSTDGDDEKSEELTPGVIEYLGIGKDIKFASPPDVDGFAEYSSVTLHGIAAGLGITYEALTFDLSEVNYTSHRAGRIEMLRNCDRWLNHIFISGCFDKMLSWFLEAASLQGVGVDGVDVFHTPPRREMVDPTREIPAEIKAIRGGLKTLSQSIREQGRNPETHLDEIQSDNQSLDQRGIILDSDPRRLTMSGTNQKEGLDEQNND